MYFRRESWKLRDHLLNDPRREFSNSEVEERRLDVGGPVCQVGTSLGELRDYQRVEKRKREGGKEEAILNTEGKRRGIEKLSARKTRETAGSSSTDKS